MATWVGILLALGMASGAAAAAPVTTTTLVDSARVTVDSTAALADSLQTSPPTPPSQVHFDHSAWSALLATHVDDQGRVAYKQWLERDRTVLRDYLGALGAAAPAAWPREEQLAFWINAYNAGIVSAILQGQSPETLIGRARLFKSWKFHVAGKDRTPDEIEHKILRKEFTEPRIHFALVCAASSCPVLRRSAYVPDSLTLQLDDQGRRFVNDPTRNVVDPAAKKLELSAIFDWFATDFERAAGTVPRFLAKYVQDPAARDWLMSGEARPRYREYDWTLNQQPFQRPERKRRTQQSLRGSSD